MNVAQLVCSEGVAGDMWLGALVDTGVPVTVLADAVRSLDVGKITLRSDVVRVRGITATRVEIDLPPGAAPVRTWREAEEILGAASLADRVKASAVEVYRRLAEAEAKVHGVPLDEVRFHELGTLDTIADIVGTCAGVEFLGLERVSCGPIALGGGSILSDHGVLPVPAPAVAELLQGFPVEYGSRREELATPTGAALVSTLASPDVLPPLQLTAHGRGVGSMQRPAPSMLTILVGRTRDEDATEEQSILEATVDDLSPQLVPVVIDRLLDAGARDAWAVPVLMKKGRPGFVLTALADTGLVPQLAAVLFTESSSIGVRWHGVTRQVLARRWVTVEVAGAPIRIKLAELDGQVLNAAPEFEDVRAAAGVLGVAVKDVHARAAALAAELCSAGRRDDPEQ